MRGLGLAVVLVVPFLLLGCGGSVLDVPAAQPQPDPPVPAMVSVIVQGGSGGGDYLPGAHVALTADPPPAGTVFDGWAGDTAALADPSQPATTLTVPAGGATVTATYRALPAPAVPGEVTASVETEPVPSGSDAADDMCIWVDPSDPARSTIIGTDKSGGYLLVYDLSGNELHRVNTGRVNNVDLRHDFPLGSERVALVAASNRSNDTIAAWAVDPDTRGLRFLGEFDAGITVYGFCLYRSALTGEFFAFVTSKRGEIEQWRIFDDGSGGVDGELVRSFDAGRTVEGCVTDDELGDLYLAEEAVGIWKYDAEPGGGTTRVKVDGTGSEGHLTGDVEGLTIYLGNDGTGYLMASSQGADEYVVYERAGNNAYVLTFEIVRGGIDGTSDTDGIDVASAALGPLFPSGLFVAQDGSNDSGRQNFKLVPWERIAAAAPVPLRIDAR